MGSAIPQNQNPAATIDAAIRTLVEPTGGNINIHRTSLHGSPSLLRSGYAANWARVLRRLKRDHMSRYCDPASLPQLPSRIGSTHLVDDSENSRQRPFPEATRCKSPKRPHGLFTSRPTNGANSICLSSLIADFRVTIRRKAEERLTLWIERARISLVASFASGDVKDEAAVRAAITSLWSNGQTEG